MIIFPKNVFCIIAVYVYCILFIMSNDIVDDKWQKKTVYVKFSVNNLHWVFYL